VSRVPAAAARASCAASFSAHIPQLSLHEEAKSTLEVTSILYKKNPLSSKIEITIAGMHENAGN
jgi:hypothetical protein